MWTNGTGRAERALLRSCPRVSSEEALQNFLRDADLVPDEERKRTLPSTPWRYSQSVGMQVVHVITFPLIPYTFLFIPYIIMSIFYTCLSILHSRIRVYSVHNPTHRLHTQRMTLPFFPCSEIVPIAPVAPMAPAIVSNSSALDQWPTSQWEEIDMAEQRKAEMFAPATLGDGDWFKDTPLHPFVSVSCDQGLVWLFFRVH